MKIKEYKTSTDDIVTSYQNVFSCAEREFMLNFAVNSGYAFGSASSPVAKIMNLEPFFNCNFSLEDAERFGFNQSKFVQNLMADYELTGAWINATFPGNFHYHHTDNPVRPDIGAEKYTLMYNVNTIWDSSWGGEILFSNMLGETEIAIDFTPGQIIKFDSRLRHRSAFSHNHKMPRFQFVSQYLKKPT